MTPDVNEPQHPELWEAWKRASDAFEACECDVCRGLRRLSAGCPTWLALWVAKRNYIDAKESYL
jgi:hypothetical protein